MCTHTEKPPKNFVWQDLCDIPPWRRTGELLIPVPWLLVSWGLYAAGMWPFGLLASFMYFLCALRLNHEAIHGNLGLSRRGDFVVLHVLSAMMSGSNSSVAYSHMLHHRHAMGPGDHEGHCGRMSGLGALIYGPRFPYDLISACWKNGGAKWRRRLIRDAVCVIGAVGAMIATGLDFLMIHLAAMAVAQCLTAFFAVWITHQGTADSGLAGRSQRGILARVAYLMFYHREHHLFPQVPVSRLPELAERLDRDVPGYARNRLPVVPFLDPGHRQISN